MTDNELREIVKKLQYQVSILGQTIDYDAHPVENLIMSMDWGPGEIDKAHDIFERWEKVIDAGGKVSQHQFEKDFGDAFGVNYQGVKPIVTAFWENGQWTDVCEAYVDSFNGMAPVEYHRIARRER